MNGNQATFTVMGSNSITYTVEAPDIEGNEIYNFTGAITNENKKTFDVTGDTEIQVYQEFWMKYDINNNGDIEKSEVMNAINDYFAQGSDMTKDNVMNVINKFFG
ncbi:hypothetical protein Metev_1211 [Methanohalobium evestigatum Z-7303]|uniref:EF-hand domain-containing protein n=1 Tax=Methanohalobium evestigatum (strain ATCC BAA-1072 / DSM 3721 / NBRC 107634 / OCM 161 / Z-7303) TaxID=644295 RepID=D7E7L3_METEZ|nr:EF-hand domain-containing protein [Methanohalobium evestigatum]ADI74086.1 hypothetical protein Metev_1211 [Methanohalobium evestigatum Z-7303]